MLLWCVPFECLTSRTPLPEASNLRRPSNASSRIALVDGADARGRLQAALAAAFAELEALKVRT